MDSLNRRLKKARQRTRRSYEMDILAKEWRRAEEVGRQTVLPTVEQARSDAADAHENGHSRQQAELSNAQLKNHVMTPPQLGECILLLILSKDERINIPGDLAEEFAEIAAGHGEKFAKVWYYKQVIASAYPLIRNAVRWGMLASIGEWIRRHT